MVNKHLQHDAHRYLNGKPTHVQIHTHLQSTSNKHKKNAHNKNTYYTVYTIRTILAKKTENFNGNSKNF